MKDPIRLGDYRYIDNVDKSKETKLMKNGLIAFVCVVISWPFLLIGILKFHSFFDSQAFGNILVIVLGFPFVAWGAHRTWTKLILKK